MRRIVKEIKYVHEDGFSDMTIWVRVEGKSLTDLFIASSTVVDSGYTSLSIAGELNDDGLGSLAENEGIDRFDAMLEVLGVLTDIQREEERNRKARAALTRRALKQHIEISKDGGGA